MIDCHLTPVQKSLLSSLVHVLKDVDKIWIPKSDRDRNRIEHIKGFPSNNPVWQDSWRDNIGYADLAVFERCGFLIQEQQGVYTLVEQAIIDAVESNFGEDPVGVEDSPQATVFICYSRKDVVLRRLFEAKLREAGMGVFSDAGIAPAELWSPRIFREIEACNAFVYLMSPDSINSVFCRMELSEAMRLGKPIVPVVIRPLDLIPQIPRQQHLNLLTIESADAIFDSLRTAIVNVVQYGEGGQVGLPILSRQLLDAHLIEVEVPAEIPPSESAKLNTGIYLIPGDKLIIRASGRITHDDYRTYCDPDGRQFRDNQLVTPQEKHPNAYRVGGELGIVGALFGWIGKYTPDRSLHIGSLFPTSGGDFGVLEEGWLYLAVNDTVGAYGDNHLNFNVNVTVRH